MTVVDLLLRPELIEAARAYFVEQTKEQKYEPLIGPVDMPALDTNTRVMDTYRPEMRKYYFDPARFKTYLEQMGIRYPTVRP
jgi:aminobenzoyl-glutamate utilization protein B